MIYILYHQENTICSTIQNIVFSENKGKGKSYEYVSEYPISTYLMCIYSGKYYYYEDYVISGKKDTVRLSYYLLDQEDIENYIDYTPIKDGIKIFSELFGKYPFKNDRYGNAQITWKYGAIEHQTITGLGTSIIKNPYSKRLVFVHELAHQWWGNAVGLKSWKDIWLNEGFATYSEVLYAEKMNGYETYLNILKSKIGDFDDNTLYAPKNNMFSNTIYNKGAWVLHMLRNKLGDEKFFKGLQSYYNKYKYKNASTDDFIAVMEKGSGESLRDFFDSWVYKGKGVLNIGYKYYFNGNDLFINLKFNKNSVKYRFNLDTEIETKSGKKILNSNFIFGNDTTLVYKNTGEIVGIVFDPKDKLLKKIEMLK
ncbi:MAG TPA: M1 family aminopeptidase [Melioribacteraceae bacterium]|nr:M1 family aminopeptidase [Melioribacteraceae bacterium]